MSDLGSGIRVVVVLACKGGGFAKVVDGRWLVAKCRKTRCRVGTEHTYHMWDLLTGRVTDHATDPITPTCSAKGDGHAVR